jgi:23S rRNA (cytosine1962-C5)-methyltransferase
MNTLPTVFLKPGEADRIIAGHPWIYRRSIQRTTQSPADGALVQVKDHRRRFLATGLYNSQSKINVRVLSPDRVEVDQLFFEERIRAALAIRRRWLPAASSFRVVNSESDFLSGLIVDKYEDVLVLQTSSLGMDQRKDLIIAALHNLLSPRTIVERNELASRKFEGLPDAQGVLAGALDGPIQITLNQLKFEVDLIGGHKTGLYLDQQQNYQKVASYAAGARVLDCFSFLGGFGLHAARGGASQVLMLDQSEQAIATASKNAELNGFVDRCSFEATNVFDWLKQQTKAREGELPKPDYDLIVLDPPSFTRTRASVPDALRGYKEIHIRALRLLKPGGVLATFCCSHHVDAQLFMDVILAAAFDARKVLRQVETFTQCADHPIVPSIPETSYLKGFAFELVR